MTSLDFWILTALVMTVACLVAGLAGSGNVVRAGRRRDDEDRPLCYTLTLGDETILLEPGKPWIRVDAYKWATRGLIEEPQSFHVLSNGTVEINGERITLDEAEGEGRLEHEINKHHAFEAPTRARPAPTSVTAEATSDRVRFHVKLDHLGHLTVECHHGGERTETGLRGLSSLVQHGLMIRPEAFYVDALQRSVEIDGHRFDCSETGARDLEVLLNERYAPRLQSGDEKQIELRDNDASPTGFDIHFVTFHAGSRLEVKGHLGQDKLDILQDAQRCDLLNRGILLRLSPPFLLVRRKRPDGGEERIPEIPDVHYRRVTAAELQGVLNHPLVRKGGSGLVPAAGGAPSKAAAPEALSPGIASTVAAVPPGFPPTGTPVSPPFTPGPPAPAAPEVRIPAPPSPTAPPPELPSAAVPQLVSPLTAEPFPPPVVPSPIEELFVEREPGRVNTEVFARLGACLEMPVQTAYFTLPRVFENRRFDVLTFGGVEISDLLELRSETFYGFYVSYLEGGNVDLVYACGGRHIEWGTRKCVLQPSAAAEAEEFPEPALLGLLQDEQNRFVFVVTVAYKHWVQPREAEYHRVNARFMTVDEVVRQVERLTFIWPVYES